MKKIIKGRRYDTNVARKIGHATNNLPCDDFSRWDIWLYKSPRTGWYFLAGSGGPMTRFGQNCGKNEWLGGEDIIPMSRREAFGWAQNYLDIDTTEDEFTDLVEEA